MILPALVMLGIVSYLIIRVFQVIQKYNTMLEEVHKLILGGKVNSLVTKCYYQTLIATVIVHVIVIIILTWLALGFLGVGTC